MSTVVPLRTPKHQAIYDWSGVDPLVRYADLFDYEIWHGWEWELTRTPEIVALLNEVSEILASQYRQAARRTIQEYYSTDPLTLLFRFFRDGKWQLPVAKTALQIRNEMADKCICLSDRAKRLSERSLFARESLVSFIENPLRVARFMRLSPAVLTVIDEPPNST